MIEFDPEISGTGEILSVSSLNELAKDCLERNFSVILVSGEISNLSKPASGHSYFTLKDESSQIRCALFRFKQKNVRVFLEDGLQVLIKAKLTLYPQRGDYQLVVEAIDGLGDGALRQRYEALKLKLQSEGLFDAHKKKPLPTIPECIGIITSDTGAAVQDILKVLKDRFPLAHVIIYPSQVQGALAVPQLIAALNAAIMHAKADVLIIARGGGSIEDLWAFNDEGFARRVASCPIPTVSAIGHEVDFTILDFVADLRAPTPTAAAMLTTPDQHQWKADLAHNIRSLIVHMERKLERLNFQLQHLEKQLKHPGEILQLQKIAINEMRYRIQTAAKKYIFSRQHQLQSLVLKLHHQNPIQAIKLGLQENNQQTLNLNRSLKTIIHQRRETLETLIQTLVALNPYATLSRGYAIVTNASGSLIKTKNQVKASEAVQIQLSDGIVDAMIK